MSLRALADGDLGSWNGVPRTADAEWVRAELGDDVEDGGALLLWRGGATGPEGLIVALDADGRVERIDLPHPNVPLEAVDALGEPELVLPTPWSRVGDQSAWPSRGLAVHAHFDGVVRVVAFVPMEPGGFAESPVAVEGAPPQRRPRPLR